MGAERWLLLLAACSPPRAPQVLCHNANCAGDAEPALDDTLGALDRSLALGPTMLDGVEIDLAWVDDRCVFAHAAHADAPDASVVAARVDDYLRANQGTPSGLPFVLYVELKPDPHVDELADCVAKIERTIEQPHELAVSSFSRDLLDASRAALGPTVTLVAELWQPGSWSLEDFEVDAVSLHALELGSSGAQQCVDLGLDLAVWTDLDTPELFSAISRFSPRYVSVARVEAVRGWLDR